MPNGAVDQIDAGAREHPDPVPVRVGRRTAVRSERDPVSIQRPLHDQLAFVVVMSPMLVVAIGGKAHLRARGDAEGNAVEDGDIAAYGDGSCKASTSMRAQTGVIIEPTAARSRTARFRTSAERSG